MAVLIKSDLELFCLTAYFGLFVVDAAALLQTVAASIASVVSIASTTHKLWFMIGGAERI